LEAPEELKKWVDSLSMAEKRFVKVLGKARAGSNNSQQLALLDWLNKAEAGEAMPADAKFMPNFATVSNRLKDLIMDGLRLLHKEDGLDALLRTTLDEVAILLKKKLFASAAKQLKRVQRLAMQTSRYGLALQGIEMEQQLVQRMDVGEGSRALARLREQEAMVLEKLAVLRDLQYRHDGIRLLTRQLTFPRDAGTLQAVTDLCDHPAMVLLAESGPYLEQILAVNILGIKDIFQRQSHGALERYAGLLKAWQAHPDWQSDQSALLLFGCNCFLIAGYYGGLGAEALEAYRKLLPDFGGMSPEIALHGQGLLYQHEFALALNTAHFERVKALLPEIDAWLLREAAALNAARVLPFLYNFAVAEFMMGRFAAASQYLRRILHLPNAKFRRDIRDFARILQLVLQFEIDGGQVNASLSRSAKRYFGKAAADYRFELLVIDALDLADGVASRGEFQDCMARLGESLDAFAGESAVQGPHLGLMEMRLWAKAKATGQGLADVFCAAVKENLDGLAV
jgi:hypothetical protein